MATSQADAACILDANTPGFAKGGTLPEGKVRQLVVTAPFDHCNFIVLDDVSPSSSLHTQDFM